ncbi:mediator of RNA polymerase II transcription subunit 15 [Scaptodrosophila lebanonensis]|uniref:Mediator of RNA polymerase II transcription subunit 15 n=1 Tax=Drosophila lebanonensis TaxID=7225 RepID=A0A6J2T3R4_DROLE|nr:mediator of RNA polymerase II transcription subunit 15 [Scaptodrosophila lebanonensis]
MGLACLLPSSNEAGNGTHGDSELSASERNRRLIPYMAFYLPAPELPINKQYAKQQPDAGGGSQLQAPAAGRIPVPLAYMPQPHGPHPPPIPPHRQLHHQQQHHHVPHYQTSAGEVYHALAIGNQQQQQQQQLLPPVVVKEALAKLPPPQPPAAPARLPDGATFIAYKPLHSTHKHKTVQHFPPLQHQQKQQQLQQHQQQHQQQYQQQQQQFELLSPPPPHFHRQRTKQSKINLTPFTAQNTLPGQFIPIIYTPVSSSSSSSSGSSGSTSAKHSINSNSNNNDPHNGNTINYNNNNNNQQPAEIVYEQHKNSHQTQIVTDYASSSSEEQPPAAGEDEAPAPAPVAALPVQPTAGITFHVYNEEQPAERPPTTSASSSSASSALAGTSALIIHHKSPNSYGSSSSKYESYFNMAPPSDQQLTMQQKYVLYLQQRMKLHKQEQQNHLQHQQQTSYQSSSHIAPDEYHQPPKYNALYGRPGEQVLHIPLRALMGHLHEQQPQTPHLEFVKDATLGTPSPPPQLIDYLIDGPRQSLDEEHQHEQPQRRPPPPPPAPTRLLRPSIPPPSPHGFILVTTAAPHTDHHTPPQLHELPAQRPPNQYKQQQSTLRLQPLTPPHNYKATRRPIYVSTPPPSTPHQMVEITPKYVYVTRKPSVTNEPGSRAPPTSTPIKLKPSHKYEHVAAHETVGPPPAPSAPVPLPPAARPRPTYVDSNDEDQLPDIRTSSLAEILHKLQASNHLPQTLTPDNIDNSIKTLIRILQNLKQTQSIASSPPQDHETAVAGDYDYNTGTEEHSTTTAQAQDMDLAGLVPLAGPNKHPGPSTGRPGIDYPNYAEIPKTSFDCTEQRYKGFFGDPETNCQVWHYCDLNGGKASFLCPNGTIFSQIALTCDWWFNVKCSTTPQLYVLNERLYKYILPFNPKFPEDYNGPIVDKYLAMKFQEMEEKMRLEKERKSKQQAEKPDASEDAATPSLPKNHKPFPKHGVNAQVYEQSSERNLLIDDEIDDISERGTYDNYELQHPTTLSTPTTSHETLSLSLKPIVVSSTPEPELDSEPGGPESAEEDKLQNLRDTSAAQQQQRKQVAQPTPPRETTKVSVERLEVIEIKTDGHTGQLMPVTSSASKSVESSEQTRK